MSNSNNLVAFNEEEEEEEEKGEEGGLSPMQTRRISSSSTTNNLVTAHVFNETVAALETAASSLQGTVDFLVLCHSSASPSNDDFRDLRTRLTKSAFLYRDLHLPLSTQIVRNLSNLMSLYDTMDDATFCEHISVVASEVKHHSDEATKVIEVHVHLLEDLNKLQMDARSTLALLDVEVIRRQMLADRYLQLQERGKIQTEEIGVMVGGTGAGSGLAVQAARLARSNPLLGGLCAGGAVIAFALSAYIASEAINQWDKYEVLHTAERKEGEMASQAAEIIRAPLIAALENFVFAVEKIAGFFQKLEGDVSNYAANAGRIGTSVAAMVIYLRLIKSQSSKIQQACGDYLEIVPAVEGRLGALSDFEASDPNHVQRWLALKFPERDPPTIA